MKIKVLKNIKAAKDKLGIEAFDYQAGETYEVFEELANVFISQGFGVKAEVIEEKIEEKAIEILEDKAIDNLEDKAVDNLENKSIKKKGKK